MRNRPYLQDEAVAVLLGHQQTGLRSNHRTKTNPDMNNTDQSPDNILRVECRSNYGTSLIYPACAKSETFARIAGTKTLNDATRNLIKSLGFQFQQVLPREIEL
jgi:hypothetical protein